MDTQTFMNDLKRYADRFIESPQNSNEFFGYFETKYDIYASAAAEEREKIRGFVESPHHEGNKPKSFFEKLFQPKQNASQIGHLLLLYVKDKVLQQLKSTKDSVWLYRGLTALSMDNFSGEFDDTAYTAYPMKGDATFLLADLFVTAEEAGIIPEPIFNEMAEISSNKATRYISMKDFMNNAGKDKFAYERRQHGKFVGMF